MPGEQNSLATPAASNPQALGVAPVPPKPVVQEVANQPPTDAGVGAIGQQSQTASSLGGFGINPQVTPDSVPPLITPPPPRQGGVSGKAVATILGVLLLVGAVGAGILLVQTPDVGEIRERAGICCEGGECNNGDTFGPDTNAPQANCIDRANDFCNANNRGGLKSGGGSCSAPPPPPGSSCQENAGGQCNTKPCCSPWVCQGPEGQRTCQDAAAPPPGGNNCNPDGNATCGGTGGWIGFQCEQLNQNGECHQNDQTFNSYDAAAAYANQNGCGQVDKVWTNGPCNRKLCGNFTIFNTGCGSVQPPPPGEPPPPPPPGEPPPPPPPGGGPTAQCLNVKVYDTNWVQLDTTALGQLKIGDVIRITVSGSASSGAISKARFTINGTLRTEVTQKKPNTQEFYDQYTISGSLRTFTVKGELFHATLGWF